MGAAIAWRLLSEGPVVVWNRTAANDAIQCYPSNIGSTEAIMLYGGDYGVWERRQTLIRCVAGSSVLVGEDDGRPNVLDSSITGCFLFSATAARLEAANCAIKDGLELSEFRAFIETALQYLPDEVRKVLDAVQAGEYRSADATIETYAQSLALFRSGFADAGAPDHLLRANLQQMRTAIRAGDGGQGLAALYRH
jgi:3-hydroxyisobutyrate dehydrogenase-like beta-hydroxyacid dehydrogenase